MGGRRWELWTQSSWACQVDRPGNKRKIDFSLWYIFFIIGQKLKTTFSVTLGSIHTAEKVVINQKTSTHWKDYSSIPLALTLKTERLAKINSMKFLESYNLYLPDDSVFMHKGELDQSLWWMSHYYLLSSKHKKKSTNLWFPLNIHEHAMIIENLC